jgi:hypothetical protein
VIIVEAVAAVAGVVALGYYGYEYVTACMAGAVLDAQIQQATMRLAMQQLMRQSVIGMAAGVDIARRSIDEIKRDLRDAVKGRAIANDRLVNIGGLGPMQPGLDPDRWQELVENLKKGIREWDQYIDELLKELFEHPDFPGSADGGGLSE